MVVEIVPDLASVVVYDLLFKDMGEQVSSARYCDYIYMSIYKQSVEALAVYPFFVHQ
jgi:hypothetical protein